MIKIAVCDDNTDYLNTVEDYLEKIGSKMVNYDIYMSGEELIAAYENNNTSYDAIFLDMEMGELDGIETANYIRQIDKYVIIIFVTSHQKYMQSSFQCMPFRFLIKPINFSDFEEVFREVCIKLDDDPETFIFLENKKRTRIFCSDIIFFESSAHSILIYTRDGKVHKTRKSIKELMGTIEKSTFVRVHRAFVVNLRYIHKISELEVIMHHYEQSIPVGRTYSKELEDMFLNFKERKYLL